MGSFSMATAKDQLKVILESQPDDSTSEEIVRELAFQFMVQRGLADSDAGRAISNVEMGRRIQSWQQ
jgi:predicted transcriptional regulator